MSKRAAYVFTCSNPDVIALSLLEDGANLPPLAQCPGPSTFSKAVPLTEPDLRTVLPGVTLAIANLKTRGYHFSRPNAVALNLPQPHRQSG
jgi:hypothetical protein